MKRIGPEYNEIRDGLLENYLNVFDGHNSFPLFRGYDQYKMLWDKGYLISDFSIIRLMWNVGRGDEHFRVIDDKTVEGLEVPVHFGRPERSDIKKILDAKNAPCFEAQCLSHHPTPGKNSSEDLEKIN